MNDPLMKFYRLILWIIGAGIVYFIWPYVSSVIVLLIFTFLITTILLPAVDRLNRTIRSRILSVLIVVSVFIGVIIWFLTTFASGIATQANEFSAQIESQVVSQKLSELSDKAVANIPDWMIPENIDVADKLKSFATQLIPLAGAFVGFFFNLVMVIIFTVILLVEYYRFKRSLVQFIPNKYFEVGLRLLFNIEKQVSSYLQGQLLAASSVAAMSIIGLFILDGFGANLTLIVFIGIIAGLANLIPLVGPFVGMVPAILIAIMNNIAAGNEAAVAHQLFGVIPSPFFILDIIFMFILVQQIDNNFITPVLVGESVGLHPMAVMIALLIGGTLLGPMGMLFAVPAAGILKVIGREVMFVTKNAHLL